METMTIDAQGLPYRLLNEILRDRVAGGARHLVLNNVRGQRYIATRLTAPDLLLEIHGVPGEDLAFCLGGPTVIVHGHAQNAAGNTMDSGTVVVHGMGGDALAYGMRGGKLFVRDSVGYRVGIHMKEYRQNRPALVLGGTSGDFLGEYMAGGTLVLLNRFNQTAGVAGQADRTLATGIHGGEIFIFNYAIPEYLPGIGAVVQSPTRADCRRVSGLVEEFCAHFNFEARTLLQRDCVKIVPAGSRPFSKFYCPSYPVDTGLKPQQAEMASPCEAACPVGIPTGRFLRHLRLGEHAAALRLLDDYTPFRYANCGFICGHRCMEECSRGRVDFPVRTVELARGFRGGPAVEKAGRHSGRVAVIGAGPAGLAAAYFLARRGYAVEIFETDSRAGGKMHQVISRRRLPLEDLDQDIARIFGLGITLRPGTRVDREMFDQLRDNHDHIIVAAGAQQSLIPAVKGKELIRSGLELLQAVNRGDKPAAGSRVVLIGGGDAAMDGIEALVEELGVEPGRITVIDLRAPAAAPRERHRWQKEGVAFRWPLFLQEVAEEGVMAVDASGRRMFIPGRAYAFSGEVPRLDFLPDEIRAQLDGRGFFRPGNGTFLTADPKISIIGDASGPGPVAAGIREARECAGEVHCRLQGEQYRRVTREAIRREDLNLERHLPLGGPEEIALQEEHFRCLHCGVCVLCDACVEACPRVARTRREEEFIVDLKKCGGCGSCAAACAGGVIRMVPRAPSS